jgi:formamidopyrimidine-DNA glycosylase
VPEGHTIHRHARLQNALLGGKLLRVSSPQGRFDDAPRFDRRKLRAVEPHGKHLLYRFTTGTVHVHLGMYGRFWVRRAGRPKAEDGDAAADSMLHVERSQYEAPATRHAALPEATPSTRMRLAVPAGRRGPGLAVDLTGPTACAAMDEDGVAALLGRLGPDPLKTGDETTGDAVGQRVRGSKAPIGTLIMDQSVLAGVGNAYRSELLFRAGLDPRTPGNRVSQGRWMELWRDTVALLRIGVKHQHILCVEPEFFGKTRYRDLAKDERFWVYKREACRRCGGAVEHVYLGNRSVYLCPAEQERLGGKELRKPRSKTAAAAERKHRA